jgi:hypothetical protein
VALRLSLDKKTVVAITTGTHGRGEAGGGQGRGAAAGGLSGKVASVDEAGKTITLVTGRDGGEKKVALAASATVLIDGQAAKLSDVKAGDRAVLKMNDDRTVASEIAVDRSQPAGGRGR